MRISTDQVIGFCATAVIALVLAACAMQTLDRASEQAVGQAPERQAVVGQASDESGLEEVTVTGSRIGGDRSERQAEEPRDGLVDQAQVVQLPSALPELPNAAAPIPSEEPAERGSDTRSLEELLALVEAGQARANDENVQRQRAFSTQAYTAGGGLGIVRDTLAVDSPLVRVMAGEEVWIISQPTRDISGPADDQTPGTGAMLARFSHDDAPVETVPLPLKHTDVRAEIAGYVGTVDVTQEFQNPFDEKIEAVYMFPLPEKAAISEFVMTIGERHIRGILREREQAEAIYAQARAQGYQASLLTQHRPNVFEQKVANIEPGHEIDVEIRYFQTLSFSDGWYSFVFPTVVGPRYNPPGSADPLVALPRQQIFSNNLDAVRYLAPSERSGHDIGIEVIVDAGVAIEEITASHDVRTERSSDATARIMLAEQATIPNRDFVLNYRVAGETIKSSLLSFMAPDGEHGYFTAMIYPPAELESLERQALELVFVLDTSGSMRGEPLGQAKDAVIAALDRLRPNDTFQIIRFSMTASQFGPQPVPATRENLRAARQYVRNLGGGGGTEMIRGIQAALDFPHDSERLRFVTFLTDGFIGNELQILSEIHARLGDSRIFSFGVGSSVNRYLLERMAGVGRGAVAYLSLEDSGGRVMDGFFDRISHPALIDIEVDWGNMNVSNVYPSRLPDLFVGRPIIVTGQYTDTPQGPEVRGRAAGRRIAFEIASNNNDSESYPFLAKLWGRLRIADLNDQRAWAVDSGGSIPNLIRATALEYGLMSDYTSFVAVDASRVTEGSHGTTVFQAVPVPDGVRYETTVNR